MTGYDAPEQVLTQTPVGRAPELPLYRDDEAVAVCTPDDEAREFDYDASVVAIVS
jgi:hypothetical protein